MNRLIKTTMLAAAGIALVSQSAQAGFTPNDLYLGFTESTAASDLIIDLGQASSLIGKTSVVDLSGDLGSLTSFNSTFNTTPNGVNMAVVGGNNVPVFGVFATQVRDTTAGPLASPAVAGSSLIGLSHSSTAMSGGAGTLTGMAALAGGLPTAGNQLLDPNKTFFSTVNQTGLSGNFIGKTGVNPTGMLDATGIIYEDLWAATTASPYTYKGFFTFNYGADSLTFTPATLTAVPEPGFYGAVAGVGLMVLSARRQFGRKTA